MDHYIFQKAKHFNGCWAAIFGTLPSQCSHAFTDGELLEVTSAMKLEYKSGDLITISAAYLTYSGSNSRWENGDEPT